MPMSLAIQYVVIALAVLLSVWVVMKKQFPRATRRLRTAIALPMVRGTRPGWVRAVGRRIAPPGSSPGAGACGGCDNCGPTTR